jgi:hypothetical protein
MNYFNLEYFVLITMINLFVHFYSILQFIGSYVCVRVRSLVYDNIWNLKSWSKILSDKIVLLFPSNLQAYPILRFDKYLSWNREVHLTACRSSRQLLLDVNENWNMEVNISEIAH